MKKCLLTIAIIIALTFNVASLAQGNWIVQTNPLGSGEQAMIGKVQFVSEGEGWISCGNGGLLHTTDAGLNWNFINPFPADTVQRGNDPGNVMSWVNETHGWIIGTVMSNEEPVGVVVYYTTDGGTNWQKKVLSTEAGTMSVQLQFVDVNTGWALLFNFSTGIPTFLKTTDGGNNWDPVDGRGIFYYADVNTGYAFSGSGVNGGEPPFTIFKTTDGGANWLQQFEDNTPGTFNAMYFSDLNNGWVVGDTGKVLKTTNGGANWTFVTNTGVNPSERCKAVFALDANNVWISNKLNDIEQTPILLHTTNGGTNWTTMITPFGDQFGYNAIFSIFFNDVNNGWITGDWGKIARYTIPIAVDKEFKQVEEFFLSQNYPNPFNPTTKISWQSPVNSHQTLRVYDVLGNAVATLINEYREAGNYEVEFNAANLSSGLYFYKLQAGDFTQTRKMTLVK